MGVGRYNQRPNLAYLVGLFRGQGMDIRVPPASGLARVTEGNGDGVDLLDDHADRARLEYALGYRIGTGDTPDRWRTDLRTSLWTDPPRYGRWPLKTQPEESQEFL